MNIVAVLAFVGLLWGQVVEQNVRVEVTSENPQKARGLLMSKAGEAAVLQVLTAELGEMRVKEMTGLLEKRLFPDLGRHLPLIRPGEIETLAGTQSGQYAMAATVRVDLPSLRRRLGELKVAEYAPSRNHEAPFFLETLSSESHLEDIGAKELQAQFRKKGVYQISRERNRAEYILRQSIDPFVLSTGRRVQVLWTVYQVKSGEIVFTQKRSQQVLSEAQTPRLVRDLINDLMGEWTLVWQQQGLVSHSVTLVFPGLRSLIEREKVIRALQTLHPQVQKVRPLLYDQEGSHFELMFGGELGLLRSRLTSWSVEQVRFELSNWQAGEATFTRTQ